MLLRIFAKITLFLSMQTSSGDLMQDKTNSNSYDWKSNTKYKFLEAQQQQLKLLTLDISDVITVESEANYLARVEKGATEVFIFTEFEKKLLRFSDEFHKIITNLYLCDFPSSVKNLSEEIKALSSYISYCLDEMYQNYSKRFQNYYNFLQKVKSLSEKINNTFNLLTQMSVEQLATYENNQIGCANFTNDNHWIISRGEESLPNNELVIKENEYHVNESLLQIYTNQGMEGVYKQLEHYQQLLSQPMYWEERQPLENLIKSRLNEQDENGNTLLHLIVNVNDSDALNKYFDKKSNPPVIMNLLKLGANPIIRNNDGKTIAWLIKRFYYCTDRLLIKKLFYLIQKVCPLNCEILVLGFKNEGIEPNHIDVAKLTLDCAENLLKWCNTLMPGKGLTGSIGCKQKRWHNPDDIKKGWVTVDTKDYVFVENNKEYSLRLNLDILKNELLREIKLLKEWPYLLEAVDNFVNNIVNSENKIIIYRAFFLNHPLIIVVNQLMSLLDELPLKISKKRQLEEIFKEYEQYHAFIEKLRFKDLEPLTESEQKLVNTIYSSLESAIKQKIMDNDLRISATRAHNKEMIYNSIVRKEMIEVYHTFKAENKDKKEKIVSEIDNHKTHITSGSYLGSHGFLAKQKMRKIAAKAAENRRSNLCL